MHSKLVLHIILLLSISIRCFAGSADSDEAVRKAMDFMHSRGINVTQCTATPVMSSDGSTPIYYIVDTGKGYVFVGSKEDSGEILGYTDRSDYSMHLIPPSTQTFLETSAMQSAPMQHKRNQSSPRNIKTFKSITPLISSQWDQGITTPTGNAYNMLSPIIDGKHTLSGCVAVAMGQVMRHHRWPSSQCQGVKAYNGGPSVGMLDSLPPIQFNWDDMMDSYIGEETDDEQIAVATLMQYCGQATLTRYTLKSSDAYGTEAAKALKSIFGYANTMRYVKRSDYTPEKWEDMLHDELQSGRPVIYFGTNTEHGHSFILDGCDSNNFYHINWGWGGRYDGYFKLSNLHPENAASGYTINQQAIIGITPADQAPEAIVFADSTAKAICVAHWDANGDGLLSYQEASKVASLNSAFKGNTKIKEFDELQYFTKLQSIEDEAFSGCTALETLELPDNITSIGTKAFKGCTKLKTIIIPHKVEEIGTGAFTSCNSLSKMVVTGDNATYDSRDGCNAIMETATNKLLAGCSASTIPATARAIGDEAFRNCLPLTTLTLPKNIVLIGQHAFAGCSNLHNIYVLCSTPPTTPNGAFDDCHATVYVPQNTKDLYLENEEWAKLTIVDLSSNSINIAPITFIRKKGATLQVDLTNNEDVIGLQFDLKLPEGVTIKKDSLGNWLIGKSERSEDLTLHCTQQPDGTYIIMLMSMTLNKIYDNDGCILTIPIVADENTDAGTHNVELSDITITLLGDNNMISGIYPPAYTTTITIKDFETGDVNHDHFINVTDVMMTVNHILGNRLGNFHSEDSDIDFNNRIDVTDVMLIVQMILDQEIQTPTQSTHSGPIFVRKKPLSSSITLDTPGHYTALQMTVAADASIEPAFTLCGSNANTHSISVKHHGNGRWTVVVYSLSGRPFDSESPTIMTIGTPGQDTDIVPGSIILTTTSLETEQMECHATDGIDETATEQTNASAALYNLSGQRVSSAYKGIVVKNGRKVLK